MLSIIGVGDNTVDTYIHRKTRFPGGNAVNVAVLAHRYGARAAYLGFVGNDEGGRQVLDSLRAEGLDISRCHILQNESTGFSTVNVIDGDRVFGDGVPGACKHLHLSPADLEYISGFDIVHTSVFSYLEPQMAELKAHSKLLCFDLSQRCDEPYLDQVLPHTDIALLSLADVADDERDSLMKKMMSYGLKLLVMTRGKQGSWIYDGAALYHQDIIPVETVDSLGAGDAFAARFLVEYASGVEIQRAMQLAAQSAAENCTHFGAYGYGKPYESI